MISEDESKRIKKFMEDQECCVCSGIMRLPVVTCKECKHSLCKEFCYKNLVKKDCPHCKTVLDENNQNPSSVREIISDDIY